MAKRFIDTGIFRDSWVSELSKNGKLFFVWLITNCDHAGVIDLHFKNAENETGIVGFRNSFETLKKEFGNRLVWIRDNYYFLPKFVTYQYPKGLSESVKAQASVIAILRKHELFDNSLGTVKKEFNNSLITVQDKDKDKDKDNTEEVYRSFDHLSITQSDFDKLIKVYGVDKVNDILDRIENHSGNKKYRSLYLTASNWLKGEKLNQPNQQQGDWDLTGLVSVEEVLRERR